MKFSLSDLFSWKKKATKENPDIGRPEAEHDVIKGIITKKCSHCGNVLPLTEYRKMLSSSDGKIGVCHACELSYGRWYRKTLKEYGVKKLDDIPKAVRPKENE